MSELGREIKRVAAGFDWPLRQVWDGFLMPDHLQPVRCPAGADCVNGTTSARAWVESVARLLLQLDDDLESQQRSRPIHPYLVGIGHYNAARPSADIREFGSGLAGRESSFFGHDSIDAYRATTALIKAAGLKKSWGLCPSCKGNGWVEKYPGQEAEAEAWEATPPPSGDWWQVWETVSEGSPVTPAFPTAEALAEHMTKDEPTKYVGTLEWITGEGWSPSGVVTGGVFRTSDDIIASGSVLLNGEATP